MCLNALLGQGLNRLWRNCSVFSFFLHLHFKQSAIYSANKTDKGRKGNKKAPGLKEELLWGGITCLQSVSACGRALLFCCHRYKEHTCFQEQISVCVCMYAHTTHAYVSKLSKKMKWRRIHLTSWEHKGKKLHITVQKKEKERKAWFWSHLSWLSTRIIIPYLHCCTWDNRQVPWA